MSLLLTLLLTYFTPCSIVFIVNFEHVCNCWPGLITFEMRPKAEIDMRFWATPVSMIPSNMTHKVFFVRKFCVHMWKKPIRLVETDFAQKGSAETQVDQLRSFFCGGKLVLSQ